MHRKPRPPNRPLRRLPPTDCEPPFAGGEDKTGARVEMAAVGRAVGVRGFFAVRAFTQTPDSLAAYSRWFLRRAADSETDDWRAFEVEESKMRNGVLVAKLCGIDCDALGEWRGAAIAVLGSDLPSLPAGEFYWRDLVGLSVANGDGVDLGRVARVFSTGANDILEVAAPATADDSAAKKPPPRLIPFVAEFVREVDMEARRVVVDWELDW